LHTDAEKKGAFFGTTDKNTSWSLGIGSKFGVTTEGALYCTDIRSEGGIITNSLEVKNTINDSEATDVYFTKIDKGCLNCGYSLKPANSEEITTYGMKWDIDLYGLSFYYNDIKVGTIIIDPNGIRIDGLKQN
jgi:hypothetical protein